MSTLVAKTPLNLDAVIAVVYAAIFVLGVGTIIAAEDWIAALGIRGTAAILTHGALGVALLSAFVALIAVVARATEEA
ncbi:hypothetical protein [Frigidibacter sp. MR17.24]|uniref:hypothetical protein n=1 Tax=Frigidibacter sp. MR17.24 TaxID=3127345 RepID=UPI003012F662